MSNSKTRINHLLKTIWMTTAVLIICIAVCSSVVRSLTPFAKQYKKDIEYHLTQLIGQPVTVQSMKTGWYWLHPVLKLDHITIKGARNSIHLDKLFVGIHLLNSLIHWRLQTGLLYVDNVHLVVKKQGLAWSIDGFDESENGSSFSENTQKILVFIAQQERLIIKNVSLDLNTDHKQLISVKNINLSIVNKSGTYKIKGTADLDKKKNSEFELLANLNFDPQHYKETQGHLYCSVKNLSLLQWQEFAPQVWRRIKKGTGALSLWVDLNLGGVSAAQAHFELNDLVWSGSDKHQDLSVPNFYANMSWKPDNNGWQFQADHISLQIGNTRWPENQVAVQFDSTQQTYLLFTKTILLESLLPYITDYRVEQFNIIKAIKPYGILNDLQIVIKNNQPNYLLSRFEQLGWNEYKKIPAVNRLSGAIQWEPQEGHLELDSENVLLAVKGYPKQIFTLLNAGLDWKELSNGLRVSMEHLALSQPELTLTLQGVLDGVTNDSLGTARLALDFSAKNIQQWMPYLPKERMKIKFFNWLNEDVKRIAELTGKVRVNGLVSEFPFDNNNGEFSITAHALGGDILIKPKWQLIKDLEGYIRLKNRNIEIDVVDGDAQGVPIKQMHLRIDDIGRDKELLLIHGIVKAEIQKIVHFILASPLKEKLSKLNRLTLKGPLSTDFQLEIPLYPENNNNLVKGMAVFDNNLIEIKHDMGLISIEDLKGILTFNETGISESRLTGTAFDYPLNINIHSVKSPSPATLISVVGECTVESLKNKIGLPLLSLFNGVFAVDALFTITTNPKDFDKLTINSNLEGLAIKLPEPLGKRYNEKTPLHATLEFNTQNSFRLRTDYNGKLNGDLFFEQNNKNIFELKSGQINLGSGDALDQQRPGLNVAGTLDGFDLAQWKKIAERFASDSQPTLFLDKLRGFNLKLNKLSFLEQQFNNLVFKGTLLRNHDWALTIQQQKISADLTYQVSNNLLSGFAHYVHLDKIKSGVGTDSRQIKPKDIPNLNLRVDDIVIGKTKVGNLTLKSHSTGRMLAIDYCRIDSPAYQLTIGGNWIEKNNRNQTNLQVKLHFNDLAKSLQYWDLDPVVGADKGDLMFNGGWPGRIYDFSLASLHGTMFLQLNNGQITHFSRETEEKLGLGKLLSILSLQTIPRRLKLDFSDLSNQGYSFDIFKGDFDVNKGKINTQNSYIDGPVAYADMKGDLDFVKRTYDLNLNISPHIAASLPVVATIAGGPIAGIAAWVASKIINQSMQKITGYSYKISGPWLDPVVQQLSIIKKTEKK